MNERTIKRPTGSAVIFLLNSLSYLVTIFSLTVINQITGNTQEFTPLAIVQIALLFATNLFISIVLFSKKYNNMLIISSGILLAPSILGLFINISVYRICDILFYLLLIAFTYVMVKMPETPLREKAVKIRFIIPVFQFMLILVSTIQTMQGLYENLVERMGTPLEDPLSAMILIAPSILGAITGFLPVLCYVWLTNWMADPYEK